MKLLSCWAFFTSLLWGGAAHCADFESFLADVARESASGGIPAEMVHEALDGLTLDPRVIQYDRAQPETVQTLDEYLAARVTEVVVEEGRAAFSRHADVIAAIEHSTGVDGQFLVAIWGIESRYGRYVGSYDVIRSLATLAFDPRRSAFFRRELIAALRLVHLENIPPRTLTGSWAGAFGQAQFMPSTFLRYAADGDGDGKRDLWNNPADIFASIASLLSNAGWQPGIPWGESVSAEFEKRDAKDDEGCRALRQHSKPITMAELRAQGINVGFRAPEVSEVTLWQSGTHKFVATANFRALLSYNCANSYALAVVSLADALLAAGAVR